MSPVTQRPAHMSLAEAEQALNHRLGVVNTSTEWALLRRKSQVEALMYPQGPRVEFLWWHAVVRNFAKNPN